MLSFKKKLNFFSSKEQFINWFFTHPDHRWILSDRYIQANILDFFATFPLKKINKIYETQEVTLHPSSGMFACSVQNSSKSVIIVFPELKKFLGAPFPGWAHAVLAHEFGHLYHEHGKKWIDPLEAQVEADSFAIELGHMEQLANFLEERPESIEKRTRLSYLTSKYFQNH